MKTLRLAGAVLLAISGVTQANDAPLQFSSGPQQVALVELYTSEGCSSCPPAEAWLGGLRGAPGLWERFVPVALHVTYWDRLGWPDRFADARFDQRQRALARRNDTGVYTPGMFLNGGEWRRWRRSAALPAGTDLGAPTAGNLTLKRPREDVWHIQFDSPARLDDTPRQAHVALLGTDVVTKVARGENRGRRLTHDFVALAHATDVLRDGRARIRLPAAGKDAHAAVAAWLTTEDGGVVQATGGWLSGD